MPDGSVSPKPVSTAVLVAAAGWVVFVTLAWLQSDLPNASGSFESINRWQLLKYAFTTGEVSLSPLDYSHPTMDSGWEFLPQRLTYVQSAGVLWAAALLTGYAICSLLTGRLKLSRIERFTLAGSSGLSVLSLWTLACGLSGMLRSPLLLFLPAAMAAIWLALSRPMTRRQDLESPERVAGTEAVSEDVSIGETESSASGFRGRWLKVCLLAACLPFVWHLLLGGVSPSMDFDVREYHLQGPREWFEDGRITSLRHNVYTSFPFLSEMVSLAAMVLRQDVREGALAGKLVLAGLQLLSALAVLSVGRRLGGTIAGLIGMLAFLATPWVCRISVIAYAEGALTCYGICTVLLLLIVSTARRTPPRRSLVLVGFLAGSAMASKYTGLVYVVAPAAIVVAMSLRSKSIDQKSARTALTSKVLPCLLYFSCGVAVAIGPWLAKNQILEGNPVYPLAWSVFGADDWSPQMESKWQNAHSPDDHNLSRVQEHLWGMMIRNDWQNGFLFALAVPALLIAIRMPSGRLLAGWSVWLIVAWWVLTHRIDRFWVPVIPLLAVLSGLAWNIQNGRLWKTLVLSTLLLTTVTGYAFSRSDLIGFHAGMIDLTAAQRAAVRDDFRFLNSALPADAKVLMVGEAEVFDVEFDVVYNTVFDENIFEQWVSDPADTAVPRQRGLDSADEIRARLHAHGITHVYVNWSEILRYRLTYGFTEFVHPDRFQRLVQMQILSQPRTISTDDLKRRSDQEREQILSWPGGASLIRGSKWDMIQLYRVLPRAAE
ncbi:MAG: hypothetical protein Fues2KO_22200 [Fuerstiella sp.]